LGGWSGIWLNVFLIGKMKYFYMIVSCALNLLEAIILIILKIQKVILFLGLSHNCPKCNCFVFNFESFVIIFFFLLLFTGKRLGKNPIL
jgi:hypothetical protein